MNGQLAHLKYKVLGDRKDKTAAIHEACSESEADVAQWVHSIAVGPLANVTEMALIKHLSEPS